MVKKGINKRRFKLSGFSVVGFLNVKEMIKLIIEKSDCIWVL